MRAFVIAYLLIFCAMVPMMAQSSFDRETVDVGNVGFSVTNVGTVGLYTVEDLQTGDVQEGRFAALK